MADRYVLLGLAPARAEWFRSVSHWCNAASVPAEFVKCLSPQQLRAQLSSGRLFSAVLVDAAAPGLDRDLLDAAGRARVPVLVVGTRSLEGAAALLPERFGPDHLLDALAAHTIPVGAIEVDVAGLDVHAAPAVQRGRVIAVCGPGGTGVSTIAIAVAQAMAPNVVLADFKLHAEQAMLHDARDVVPGVQELVESHRTGRERPVTFRVVERGYDLLLGLRRARAWSAIRPRAFEAAFDSLRSGWGTVVCDVDADVEGEKEGGSADIEERNVMARTALAAADAVLLVGLSGMKGVHSMVRVVADLIDFGVESERIIPVVNRAPRSPRARSDTAAALAGLVRSPLAPPVFLPERRIDDVLRDGGRLPPVLTAPLAAAVGSVATRPVAHHEPVLIKPGSLGAWSEG
jgi:MinD-like ATPase involved in chromosome partitioning or flagellar assembly